VSQTIEDLRRQLAEAEAQQAAANRPNGEAVLLASLRDHKFDASALADLLEGLIEHVGYDGDARRAEAEAKAQEARDAKAAEEAELAEEVKAARAAKAEAAEAARTRAAKSKTDTAKGGN
jgi:hypothetical protein